MAKKIVTVPDVLRGKLSEYLLSARALAQALGVTQPAISSLLSGKVRLQLPMAFRLAKYFGTTVEYWTKLQEEKELRDARNDAKLQKDLKAIGKAKKPTKTQIAAAKEKEERAAKRKKASSRKATADAPAAKRGRKPRATKVEKAETPSPRRASRKPAVESTGEKKVKVQRGRKPRQKAQETPPETKKELKSILIKKNSAPKKKSEDRDHFMAQDNPSVDGSNLIEQAQLLPDLEGTLNIEE